MNHFFTQSEIPSFLLLPWEKEAEPKARSDEGGAGGDDTSTFSRRRRGAALSEQLTEELVHLMAGLEIADALDFPMEPDTRMFENAGPHRFAEIFKFVSGRRAGIDHEIAVQRRHLRAADHQPPAAGFVDLLPRRGTLGVLE